jgi:hypothetical protein
MAKLNYDIDFFSIMPDQILDNPEFAKLLGDIGVTRDAPQNITVLFRDPATVAALREAPEAVRNWLLNAGMGLNVFDPGAPPGQYSARFEQHHIRLIKRLTDTVGQFDLPKAGTDTGSAFKVSEFITALLTARPMAAAAARSQAAPLTMGSAGASATAGFYNPARELRLEKEAAQRKALKQVLAVAVLAGLGWYIFFG